MARADLRRHLGHALIGPLAAATARTRIPPNALTVLGLVPAAGAAGLLASGQLAFAGILVLAAGAFDLLDGATARALGRATPSGALLDSTVDRLSEGIVLLGLVLFFAHDGAAWQAGLVLAAAVTSTTVSYIRARAEGLGIPCTVGLVTRPERVVGLGVGLLCAPLWAHAAEAAVAAVAAGSAVTATQRFAHVWRALRRSASA